ncbi:hypothetical protein CSKR_114063 [Clonorchis sinensis]|uniref:Uncharacterized protein n=1 Tax=Clonorchis sinensis TaxID=79923 RepID=A0A3R7EX99_CLOSI|nr:hypothetical protein CSKR_114063 [Clonorchis sinensis]
MSQLLVLTELFIRRKAQIYGTELVSRRPCPVLIIQYLQASSSHSSYGCGVQPHTSLNDCDITACISQADRDPAGEFEIAQQFGREFNGVLGSNPISASRLLVSRPRQTGRITTLVFPLGRAAAMHRSGVTAERFFL